MTAGGEGVVGIRHSDEAKKRMSEMKSGANHPNYGKHLKESTRAKISERLQDNHNAQGSTRSAETRERMSRSKYKPVASYLNGKLIKVFDSAISAQRETGISRKNISLCCNNQRKHAGGFAWKFV